MHPLSPRSSVPSEISLSNEKNCSFACTCSSKETKSRASVPVFAKEDEIFMQLQELGICDEKFNPLPQFATSSFPVLSHTCLEDQPILKSLHEFFTKGRHVNGEPNDHVTPFTIEFTFRELFKSLREISQAFFKDSEFKIVRVGDKAEPIFTEFEGTFPIEEVTLINFYLIEVLGKYPFIKFCKEQFLSHIPPETIENWFQLPHIHAFFNQKAENMCMNTRSKGPLKYQEFLREQVQNFLIGRMENFDREKYCEFLKLKYPQYSYQDPSNKSLKKVCFQNCGDTKWETAGDKIRKYPLFGNKTDDRPFELIFVQSDSNRTGLPFSSRNCFSCDILPFLENENRETDLPIRTEGFSWTKTVIDLVTNSISSDANHNVWFHNLKDYKRFTIQVMEADAIRCFFSHNKSDTSKSGYFVSQLEEELKKETKTDPLRALQFLLRASVSLHEHHPISEEEISEIWKLMDQGQYLKLDPTDSSHAFGIALKNALIDQKLPFSIVYAWIGMVGFLAFPTSFTRLGWADEGPTHAFELKHPFSLRVAADPKNQCQTVFAFLQKNPKYLSALMQIYHSLESHRENTVYPHLLQGCFKLDFDSFFKEEWLAHPDVSLNDLGEKLYLIAAGEGITNAQIDTLFSYLTKISKENLEAIETLVEKLPEYRDALDLFEKKSPVSNDEFIESLINTRQKPLAQLALRLWRKSNSASKEINWLIFNALTVFNPQEALKLLLTKTQEGLLKVAEQCKGFLLLLDRSQKNLEIPFLFNELIPFLSLLINSTDISAEDKKKIGQKVFPILKSQCHLIGEEALLKASQAGFFESESLEDLWLIWLEHKLESGPINTMGILFYTLEEKKYIIDSSRLQEFKVKLGARMLQEKENALTQKLLEELIRSSPQPTTLAPLYDLLSQFLTSALIQPNKELMPLLKYLVDMTSEDKIETTTELIKLLCKNAVDPLLLPLIEELLTYPPTLGLLEKDPEGHTILLSYLEATVQQPVNSLETRKSLFLSEEAKKMFSNHKDLVKECVKNEAKKLLDDSHVGERALSFIFELFEFYLTYDENLWLKFLETLGSKGSKEVQESSSALFKKIESTFSTRLVRTQCWVLYLKCLRKIDHPDILAYFDSLESLKGIFLETDIEKRMAYREILLAQITLLSSNRFDQNHYENIIECYQSLREEDMEIEKALISNVHTKTQKICFQGVCARLTKIIVDFHENKDSYDPFVELIEGIFVDEYQDKFIEEATELLKAILSQKEYPKNSCARILFFLQKSKISLAFSLFERVIEDKNLLRQLKEPFLSLFPLALKHDSLDKIKEREEQLNVALNTISFEPREEAKVVDAFLSRFFVLCGNEEAINAVETFAKWAEILFEHPELMKKHVKAIVQISLFYADPSRPELQNQEKFSKCVQEVISIKYRIPQEVSKCKITRKGYLKWCMQCWKELKLKEEFFAAAMHNLISNHIQEYGTATSLTSVDILDELEEFVFFWPIAPTKCIGIPYLLFEEIQNKIDFDLLEHLQALTLNARAKEIFQNHPMKLAKLWLYLQISEHLELPHDDVFEASSDLISKLLLLPISSQVLFSIILLNQWDDVNEEKHFKVYLSQVEQIVPKCLEFPFAVYSKESLLKIVYNKTLKDLQRCTSRCQMVLPMAKLQLDSAWRMYEQAKKSNLVQYRIHYLELCMDVLRRHLAIQGKNRDYKNFDKWLRKFMPEIISLEQQEWILNGENPLSICEKDDLMKKFFGLIVEFENPNFPSNDKEKRIGKALIISLLDGLMAVNAFNLVCNALAIINNTLFSLFTPNDVSCSVCFGKVEKWLPQGPDFHRTDLEIIGINFHSKNLLKDYHSYLKRVDQLITDLFETERAFEIQHSLVCVARMLVELPEKHSKEHLALREKFYNHFFQFVQKAFEELPQDEEDIANGILQDLLKIAMDAGLRIT